MSIGIFDSGVGGLSVLKKMVEILPDENYIYLGDTARVPYGEKTKEELTAFSREILDYFKQRQVKLVLMACNTSSANTLDVVKGEYDFKIFGLIKPTAEYISTLPDKRIGLMATSATVNSKAYPTAIEVFGKEVFDLACPPLVGIVESGMIFDEQNKKTVKQYLNQLLAKDIQRLILGCTHYPFLVPVMKEEGLRDEFFIDPADCIKNDAKKYLEDNKLLLQGKGSIEFLTTGDADVFETTGKLFFDKVSNVKHIELV
ncbi:MAG: glutamate racemase [Candidatus Gastranaerophilales bacterium]|nr:glutamate racemase [Candidatus Gastranaerophilales bacterium]